MKVKLILPALTEATSPFFRPIKYSLFPPLGLATLAAYLDIDDEVLLVDEHVQSHTLDDDPDLVLIQVYITNAKPGVPHRRSLPIARDPRRPGGAARHLAAPRGPGPRRPPVPGTRRAHLPSVPGGSEGGASRGAVRVEDRADPGGGAPDPTRSDRAAPLPRPQLDRGHPRLSAPLRLLLQGCVL